MEYKQSIKTLESAKKSIEGIVIKMHEGIKRQEEKIAEFNSKVCDYEKAIKKLSKKNKK